MSRVPPMPATRDPNVCERGPVVYSWLRLVTACAKTSGPRRTPADPCASATPGNTRHAPIGIERVPIEKML